MNGISFQKMVCLVETVKKWRGGRGGGLPLHFSGASYINLAGHLYRFRKKLCRFSVTNP